MENVLPELIRMAHHETEIAVEVREEALESLIRVKDCVEESEHSFSPKLVNTLRDVFIATFETSNLPSQMQRTNIPYSIVKLEDTEGCLYDTNEQHGLLSAVVRFQNIQIVCLRRRQRLRPVQHQLEYHLC